MVVQNLVVAPAVVVVPAVLRGALLPVYLAGRQPEVPDFRIVLYFSLFVLRQPVAVQTKSFRRCHREPILLLVVVSQFVGTVGVVVDGGE